MDTIKIKNSSAGIIAHRGLSGVERENTNAAFIEAGVRNYWGIESDVHVTKDGKYIMFHDDKTGRLSLDNLRIKSTDSSVLLNLPIKDMNGLYNRPDLKIPTLDEYIDICKKYQKVAVLEIKNKFSLDDIKGLVTIIEDMEYIDSTVFISFELDNLLYIRKVRPHQSVQYLTSKYSKKILKILMENNFDIDIDYSCLDEKIIHELKANRIKMNCWTCDDKVMAEKLIDSGVDFVTTNILQAI